MLNTENGDISTTMNQQQISESPEPRKRSDVHCADCSGCDHEHRRLLQRQFFDLGDARHLKSFTINGMGFNDTSTNVNMSGAMNLPLGQNQIQEATIVSNGYSGRLGGAAGANINYITKSGATTFTAAFVNGFAAGQTLAQSRKQILSSFRRASASRTIRPTRRNIRSGASNGSKPLVPTPP